jgi:hypothetical protein
MIRQLTVFLVAGLLISYSALAVAQTKQDSIAESQVLSNALVVGVVAPQTGKQAAPPPAPAPAGKPAPGKPQPAAKATSSDKPEPKWEIEVHGGMSSLHQTGGWNDAPAAESYSLSGSGAFGYTSSRVSSYYFGDGAELIGLSSTMDSTLTKTAVMPQDHTYGFRFSRNLTKWLAAEFTYDRPGKLEISNTVLDQVETARAGFAKFWKKLDVPGNTPSTSVSTISRYGSHPMFMTGAAVLSIPKWKSVRPYATFGAGVYSSGTTMPSVTLAGSYGGPTALETDTVRVDFTQEHSHAIAGLVGGGFKIYLTRHVGIRLDARLYIYDNPATTLLSANHTNTQNAAWVVKASGGTLVPDIQLLYGTGFSSYSTLSGPAVSKLKTFFSTGTQWQAPLTVGFFYRF